SLRVGRLISPAMARLEEWLSSRHRPQGRRREQNSAYGSLRSFGSHAALPFDKLRAPRATSRGERTALHGDMKRLPFAFLAVALAAFLFAPAVARVVDLPGLWRGRAEAAEDPGRGGGQRPRPAEGRQPELAPPTIRDYKPKSQLVAPQHPVPRAKFPVIDIHSHQPTPISPAEFDRVFKGMEANNLQILVNLSGSSGSRLQQGVEALRASKYKDRMVLFANINFRESVGPGFGAKAAKQLEADIKAGAMGLRS